MKRYGWTRLKFGARRFDGVTVSPPLGGGSAWSLMVPVPPLSVTIPLSAIALEAACEECDERYPLPEWWRPLESESTDQAAMMWGVVSRLVQQWSDP